MTLLGRIFTLLVLLLSLAFFIISLLANASHIDHKKKISTYQTQSKQLETTVDELKKQIEQLQTARAQEMASRQTALAALQTQLEIARADLATANKENTDKTGTLTQQTQQLSEAMDRVKQLTNQCDMLKSEIDKVITDRNDQRRRVIALQDKFNALQSVEADLLVQVAKLQESATYFQAKSDAQESALKTAGIKDPDDVPPADLKGEVLAVNAKQQVVISVGKDDGLREGHRLDVYRTGQYLGKIQIQSVKDDQAVGQILTGYRKGYIQAGDKVAAKIN
jgi:predicted  nucleic acid-binding Zn-ribbon protein